MKDIFIKIFVFFTLVFAYIITSRTPMMWEDVVYTLKADAALGAAMSNSAVADTIQLGRYERVQNVSDLIESSYFHYMNANGRLFPHMTSQAFGALIGKPVFDVLNAIMFVLLVTVATMLVVGYRKDYWKWWVVVLSGLWLAMPESNTGFFLMTYALNYLWSSVFCLAFLWIYIHADSWKTNTFVLLLGCLSAFGAGWSHEGVAIGIAASIAFDNLWDMMHHRVNCQKMLWAICFCVGAAFLCLSPGNFTRTDAALPLYNHLLSFARLRVFWILLLSWCLFSRRTAFLRQNYLLLIALSVQMLFMFYAGFRNSRVLWGTELFSLILLLRLITAFEKQRIFAWVTYALLTLLTIHFGWLIYRSGEVRRQYDEVIALYVDSKDGTVYYDLHPESELVSKYIPTPLCGDRYFERLCFSLYYTRNQKPLNIVSREKKKEDSNGE